MKAWPHWRRLAEHPEPYVRQVLARGDDARHGAGGRPGVATLGIAVGTVTSLARDALARLRRDLPDLDADLDTDDGSSTLERVVG